MVSGRHEAVQVPDLEAVREALRPSAALEAEIRAFLRAQLGQVLPPDPVRGLEWYYNWVVLGERSREAFAVLEAAVPPASEPVLDLGSGLGTFVLLANRFGLPAIGIEPGGEELTLARKRAEEMDPSLVERFSHGVGEELPLADGTVRGVLLHDVLEHVVDWRAVLSECRRVLCPGGAVYIKGPSYTTRLIEPHYRVPWLPLMPKSLARRYLGALGRDVGYLEHLGYRRRDAVVRLLRRLDFELDFPRLRKLSEPDSVNRPWLRRLLADERVRHGPAGRILRVLAENNLQWAIDVVARKPAL